MLCLWGGNANNGTNCGLGYSNSNNDFSISNTNYGARLTYEVIVEVRRSVKETTDLRVPQTLVVHSARKYQRKCSQEQAVRVTVGRNLRAEKISNYVVRKLGKKNTLNKEGEALD